MCTWIVGIPHSFGVCSLECVGFVFARRWIIVGLCRIGLDCVGVFVLAPPSNKLQHSPAQANIIQRESNTLHVLNRILGFNQIAHDLL